jgi:DNA-directed RNA polymerase subunit RPC12/RpoP
MNTANTKPAARDDVAVASVLIAHRRIPLLAPAQEMICSRCGTTYDPTEDQQDRALLLAACCPRCDGHRIWSLRPLSPGAAGCSSIGLVRARR